MLCRLLAPPMFWEPRAGDATTLEPLIMAPLVHWWRHLKFTHIKSSEDGNADFLFIYKPICDRGLVPIAYDRTRHSRGKRLDSELFWITWTKPWHPPPPPWGLEFDFNFFTLSLLRLYLYLDPLYVLVSKPFTYSVVRLQRSRKGGRWFSSANSQNWKKQKATGWPRIREERICVVLLTAADITAMISSIAPGFQLELARL